MSFKEQEVFLCLFNNIKTNGVWRSLYVCFWFVLLIVLRPLCWWPSNGWWIIIMLHSAVQGPAETWDNGALYVNCLVKFKTLRDILDNFVHGSQHSVWQKYDEETRGRLESLALYKYSHQSGNESARQNVKFKTVNQKPCSVITFKAVNEVYPKCNFLTKRWFIKFNNITSTHSSWLSSFIKTSEFCFTLSTFKASLRCCSEWLHSWSLKDVLCRRSCYHVSHWSVPSCIFCSPTQGQLFTFFS